jgi:hypothetical protein
VQLAAAPTRRFALILRAYLPQPGCSMAPTHHRRSNLILKRIIHIAPPAGLG